MYASKRKLERVIIKPFFIEAFDGELAARPIREVVAVDIDLEGYKERIWFYITPLGGYDLYLGIL